MTGAQWERRAARVLAAGLCAAAVGCVKETPTGSGSAFTFEPWVPAAATLAALAVLAVGVVLVVGKKSYWSGGIAAVAGLVGAAVAPGMFFDRAVVDDDHFELRTGFWFAPTRHEFRFADVTSIQGVAEEKTGRRGRKSTDFSFVVATKAGTQKIPLGDLMKRGPADRVVAVAAKHRIPLSGVMPDMD